MCEPLEQRVLLSKSWYVDPVLGSDSSGHGTGTGAAAYKTIQYALDASTTARGDSILLASGTYREDVTLRYTKRGNSWSSMTTIAAAPGATPIIDGSDVYTTGWTQVGTSAIYKRTGWTAMTQQVALNGGTVLTQIGTEFVAPSSGAACDEKRVTVGSNSTSSMVAGSFFCDTANDVLYVWLPDSSNPNGQNVNVSARDNWMIDDPSNSSYYLISGITFQYNNDTGIFHTPTNVWLGQAIEMPSNSTIQNCTIRWSDGEAIGLGSGSKVLNNTITYSGCNGVVGGTSNFLVSGNHVLYSNYRHFAADWGSGGIKLMPDAYGTVSGNEIAYSNGTGLWSDTNQSGSWLTFSSNYVHDNIPTAADYFSPDHIFGEAGIKVEVSSYVRVYNNVVVGNFGNGILVCASNNALVYNNTVVGNEGYAGIQVGQVPRQTNNSDCFLVHNRVYNNIIANNYTMYDLMIQADYYTTASWDTTAYWWAQDNLSDNNLIYRWGGPLQLTTGSPYGKGMTATQTTLASWRTASGADNSGDSGASQDLNSISVDPLFLPASEPDDYLLGSNSPAINAGANTVPGTNTNPSALFTTDYSSTTRSGTYDIGAYEYHAGDPVGIAGTVPPTDSSAWVDDALPQGAVPTSDASPHDNWSWLGTGLAPVSGTLAMESAAYDTSGIHSTEFNGATAVMSVKTGDTLYAWVYLDPADPPSEIMIQWRTGSSWEHRAYWGANSISYGTNNTNSRRYVDVLPKTGGWVKLQIAASQVGLEGVSVNGLSLVEYNGRAAWDDIGTAPAAPAAPSNLAVSIPVIGQMKLTWKDNSSSESGFNIERSADGSHFSVVGAVGSGATTYTDTTFDSSSTTLYYRVQAYNANGGNYSSTTPFRIPPDNAFFLDEGSGLNTVNGYGQSDGTLSGTRLPTWSIGKSGEALNFDGISTNGDYVGCGNDSSFDAVTGLTLSAWFRPSSTGGWTTSGVDKRNAYRLVSVDVGTTGTPVTATHFQFALYDSTGTFQSCASTQTYTTNAWHYVVGTYDGTTMTLYVDGAVSQTVTQTDGMSTSTYPFEIGRRDGTRYYSGAIDEVRMYSRAISKAEMTAAYDSYDLTSPTASIAAVSPNPRTTAVDSMTITFSEPVAGFDLSDLVVSRNGGSNLLTGSQTLTTSDNMTFVLGNLTALTGIAGSYAVTVDAQGSGTTDLADNPLSANATQTWQTYATVAGRWIFYNNSYFDGNNAAANSSDDAAVATDKQALLPGQIASFVNYTSYSRGIDGIMLDVAGLAAAGLSASDFTFLVGNNSTPGGWIAAPAPSSITVRAGAGLNGSDRVELIWPDNAIGKQWLQVTVLADVNTGLAFPDVFYFGNAIGETGNDAGNTFVDGSDFAGARDNPHNFLSRASVIDAYDINRDSFVDGSDLAAIRDNNTNFLTALKLIAAPGPAGAVSARPASVQLAETAQQSTTAGGTPGAVLTPAATLTPGVASAVWRPVQIASFPGPVPSSAANSGSLQTILDIKAKNLFGMLQSEIKKLLHTRRSKHG